MSSDTEIGRVVTVDTSQVTVELLPELKALARSTFEGPQEVGRINSYVIIPVGARRLVAMVTRVLMSEQSEISSDRTMVTLPSARRLMKATLIGTIEEGVFSQGVSVFPILHSAVHLVGQEDLRTIFDVKDAKTDVDPDSPGFVIEIGESLVSPGFTIRADPDAMFGKHLAVLGSTGSGKSCTIAAMLQAVLALPAVSKTTVVVLDTNGEYAAAFPNETLCEGVTDCLYIPSADGDRDRLVVPYWFMNSDDFVRLFRAREGLQAPVLLRALRLARAVAGEGAEADPIVILEVLRTATEKLLATAENTSPNQQWAIKDNVVKACDENLGFRTALPDEVAVLDATYGAEVFAGWEAAIQAVRATANAATQIGGPTLMQIRQNLEPVLANLNSLVAELGDEETTVSADQPSYFNRTQLLEKYLATAMREQAESGNPGRVREACGPMLLRIRRFVEDRRFRFLMTQFPDAANVLAAFIRDILGLESVDGTLAGDDEIEAGVLPFYDRQRAGTKGSNVVVVDLSLLSSEVLENVAALLGRLILEFQQRLGDTDPAARGSLPVVLVLEEAQNYIPERRSTEESISRAVFERIAREGRKYGLGLVVASQRPSELSRTVLSQCSSFIVHRLQNPEDLRYFREVVPGVYEALLEQLPALAARCALVFGEFVRAPGLVKIREACPTPRSRDPRFYRSWVDGVKPDVERVCADWENRPVTVGESGSAEAVMDEPPLGAGAADSE